MDDLISKSKLLKDLAGMYDVMLGAGDPFLASMIRKAMECVERQPAVEAEQQPVTDSRFWKALIRLEAEYKNAVEAHPFEDPLAFALVRILKQIDAGVL